MKKYIGQGIGIFLELVLVAGTFAVQHFTNTKMGMARHVIFKNQSWEKAYPLEQWKILSIIVLMVMLALVAILLIRRWKVLGRYILAEGAVMAVLTAYSLWFTLAHCAADLRPYYFMSPMLAAAALLQIIRTGILVLRKKA